MQYTSLQDLPSCYCLVANHTTINLTDISDLNCKFKIIAEQDSTIYGRLIYVYGNGGMYVWES